MRMLVLGAGLQGSACAYDLLQNPDVTEVRLADLNVDVVAPFLTPYIGKRLVPTVLDVRDRERVLEQMGWYEPHESAITTRRGNLSPRARGDFAPRQSRSSAKPRSEQGDAAKAATTAAV